MAASLTASRRQRGVASQNQDRRIVDEISKPTPTPTTMSIAAAAAAAAQASSSSSPPPNPAAAPASDAIATDAEQKTSDPVAARKATKKRLSLKAKPKKGKQTQKSASSAPGIKTFFSPSKPSEDELTTKKEKKPTADIKVDVTVKDKDKELPSAETPATTVENKAVAAPVAASSSAKAAPAASAQKRAPVSKKKPKKGGKAQQQGDLRDHFVHVRSSSRVSAGVKKKQAEERITNMIRDGIEPGLKVIDDPAKGGKTVLADRRFSKGEYVCEYSGELVDKSEAEKREKMYAELDTQRGNLEPMCYVYYFKHGRDTWCVDATIKGRVGRLINHSRGMRNIQSRVFVVDGKPHLGFIALRDIEVGEELFYDYGDRSKSAIEAHPWLKT